MATYNGQPGVQIDLHRNDTPTGCPQGFPTQLGSSCFYPDPGKGAQWLQLVVLNRQDLSYVDNHSIPCPQATQFPQEHQFDFSAGGDVYYNNPQPCIQTLVNYIRGLNSNELVIAANQPGDGTNKQTEPPVGAAAALSGKFVAPFPPHNLGIGAPQWFDAPGNGVSLPAAVRGTFSAIGVPGTTSGGIANLAASPDAWSSQGAGALNADVAVDNNGRSAPIDPPSADVQTQSPVSKVLVQPPTAWPKMTPGQAAAFSAVGVKVGLGPDPRTQYYSSTQSDTAWKDDKDTIAGYTCRDFPSQCQAQSSRPPGSRPPAFTATAEQCQAQALRPRGSQAPSLTGAPRTTAGTFTNADLSCAKTELADEIGYLIKVDSYLHALARPFKQTGQTLWANVGTAVANVNATTSNGQTAQTLAVMGSVISTALDFIPELGEALKWSKQALIAAHGIVAGYGFALEMAETGGEPSGEEFSVAAADLGAQIANRLNNADEEIEQRWHNIIVADYGKLQTVAHCSQPAAPCGDAWNLTPNDLTQMERLFKYGAQKEAYETLVPVKYPLALGLSALPSSRRTVAGNAANWCKPLPPFGGGTGVYIYPSIKGLPDWVEPIVLTAGTSTDKWEAAGWTVLSRMFDPIDPGGNFDAGGLAINEDEFMKDTYGLTPDLADTSKYQNYPKFASLAGCLFTGWSG